MITEISDKDKKAIIDNWCLGNYNKIVKILKKYKLGEYTKHFKHASLIIDFSKKYDIDLGEEYEKYFKFSYIFNKMNEELKIYSYTINKIKE